MPNLIDQYIEKHRMELLNNPVNAKIFGRPTMDDFLRRCEELRNQLRLSQQEIEDGVHSACDFFGIPYPMMIIDLSDKKYGQTMFVSSNPSSYEDDVICYNVKQLQSLGVHDKSAFTLIMTHECAHRIYQTYKFGGPFDGAWAQELACDFYMGVRSVIEQLNIQSVIDGLSQQTGCPTHPDGDLRQDVVRFGINVVLQFMHNGTALKLENFHNAIMVYLSALEMDLNMKARKYYRQE